MSPISSDGPGRRLSPLYRTAALLVTVTVLISALAPSISAATPDPRLPDEASELVTHLSDIFELLGVTPQKDRLVDVALLIYGARTSDIPNRPTRVSSTTPTTSPSSTPTSHGSNSLHADPGDTASGDATPGVTPPDADLEGYLSQDFDPYAEEVNPYGSAVLDPVLTALAHGDDPGPLYSPLEYNQMVNRSFASPAFSQNQWAGTIFSAGGFTCPVAGPVRFINDWGFPRSKGRSHKGTDMFAPRGTPVVAVANATVFKLDKVDNYVVGSGVGDLGGITLWIRDAEGVAYYYAHLNSIDPSLYVGAKVLAGQYLGEVGNTGNAATTSPHLHFQVHPGGGAAVNPYPIIWAPCRPTNNPPPPSQ